MKNIIPLALALLFAACTKPADKPAAAGQAKAAPQVSVEKFLRGDLKALKGWEDLKGKAVVLEFWGTYCEPCIENIPHLNGLAEKFKGKPVVFISLSREPQAEVEEFLKTHEMSGNVAADAAAAFRSFRVNGIPHTVLIDKDGLLRADTYPSRVTESVIEALLAGGPAVTAPATGPQPGR